MAAEDFGGKELGRPIEVLAADTATKADLSSAQAREWFTNGHVAAIMEVVGSSAALAVQEVGRIQNKIVTMSAPASLPLINENCSPTSVLYTYTTYSLAHSVGEAVVAQGGKIWFFIAADHIREDGLMVHDMYLFQVKTRPSPRSPGITTGWSRRFPPTARFRR